MGFGDAEGVNVMYDLSPTTEQLANYLALTRGGVGGDEGGGCCGCRWRTFFRCMLRRRCSCILWFTVVLISHERIML